MDIANLIVAIVACAAAIMAIPGIYIIMDRHRQKAYDISLPKGALKLYHKAMKCKRRGKYGEEFKLLVRARREDGLEDEAQALLEWELGRCWVQLGFIEDAIESYENALPDSYEDALYPWQAEAYEELAALYETGEEALRCYRNAAQLRDRFGRPEDESTVSLLRKIADMLWDDGEEDEARVWYNKEIAVRDRLLPKEVDELAERLIAQGEELMQSKQYDQAAKEFTKAMETLVPRLGMLHTRVINICNYLALAYDGITIQYAQNKNEFHRFALVRVECWEKALNAIERLFQDCEFTAQAHGNAGDAWKDYAMLDFSVIGVSVTTGPIIEVIESDNAILLRAVPHYERALQIFKENIGNNMPIIARIHRALGKIYGELGRHKEAIAELSNACPYYQKTQENDDLALTYLYLATTYCKMCSYTESLSWFFFAWRLFDKLEQPGPAEAAFEAMKEAFLESELSRGQHKPFEEWLREQTEAEESA